MNGAVEATNKNIKKIIQKMVVMYKYWHEILPYTLHGYRMTIRTSTRETPFSLVYGIVIVLAIEVEIPLLRVLADAELEDAELAAICYGQLYQKKIKRAFDKTVRPQVFHEENLVLKKILPTSEDHKGK
ncbi:hypothetical protein CR513_01313, partial [Mucuna pruriens]